MTDRKFFVGGNWKMNGNKASIDGIIGFLTAGPLDPNTGNKHLFAIYLLYIYIFDAVRIFLNDLIFNFLFADFNVSKIK